MTRVWFARLASALFIFGVSSLLAQDGAGVYKTRCAACHEAGGEMRMPNRESFRQMSPEQIMTALEKGAMTTQGSELTSDERRSVAEFLSGKRFEGKPETSIPESAFCGKSSNAFQVTLGPAWNGWGITSSNTRFQPAEAAGMSIESIPRLKLEWAFGFPGEVSASAQPVIVGGRLFIGSYGGKVYSLDAKSGCIYWIFEAKAGVRSAISIGETGNGNIAAYFGDARANVYALNAATGEQLWQLKVDDFPTAGITGAPKLHEGRLYVPVTPREEGSGGDPKHECCKSRGSLVALDARSGRQLWKSYAILQEPRPTQKNAFGTQLWGPSGAGIWSSPTLDLKRKLIYVGTGNNYSPPATDTSDAIIAFDMESGRIMWVRQLTPGDTWNSACIHGDPANCLDPDDPDFDFGASPVLVKQKNGREILVAGQKSGVVYALDPDRKGEIVWEQRVGVGGTLGGVEWGLAVDDENVYAAVSDIKRLVPRTNTFDPKLGGGFTAIDLSSGKKVWYAPPPKCEDKKLCNPAQSAAVTAIPGVVFSGSDDGHLRAYSTRNGKILWDYDTAHEYTAVNGVKANGGSIDGGGPAVVGGMLFTNSGNSRFIPGNVLLAFSVAEE